MNTNHQIVDTHCHPEGHDRKPTEGRRFRRIRIFKTIAFAVLPALSISDSLGTPSGTLAARYVKDQFGNHVMLIRNPASVPGAQGEIAVMPRANNSDAIQQAIDYLVKRGVGGTVQLSSGTYDISSDLVIGEGQGPAQSEMRFPGAGIQLVGMSSGGTVGGTILRITRNAAITHAAIHIRGGQVGRAAKNYPLTALGVKIKDLNITIAPGGSDGIHTGIFNEYGQGLVVENVRIVALDDAPKFRYGIRSACWCVSIKDGIISNTKEAGVVLTHGTLGDPRSTAHGGHNNVLVAVNIENFNVPYSTGTIAIDATGRIVTLSGKGASFGEGWGAGDVLEIGKGKNREKRVVAARKNSTRLTLRTASAKRGWSGLTYALSSGHGYGIWVAGAGTGPDHCFGTNIIGCATQNNNQKYGVGIYVDKRAEATRISGCYLEATRKGIYIDSRNNTVVGNFYNQVTTRIEVAPGMEDGNVFVGNNDNTQTPGYQPEPVSFGASVGVGTASPDEAFEVEWGPDVDVEVGRGTMDPGVTFITLRNKRGKKYYVYVDDSGKLQATTIKP